MAVITGQGVVLLKKAIILALIALLIVPFSGCLGSGSPPPTIREELASLDAAIAQYQQAYGLYSYGDYTAAHDDYVKAVDMFKDCQSKFTWIASGNLTALDKRIATNLAGCSMQYSRAAAYMRDSSTEAMKPAPNNAYLFQTEAEEFEQSARLAYQSNVQDLALEENKK